MTTGSDPGFADNAGPQAIRADTAAVCALIVVAPQLFGGAFPWSVVAISGLSVATLASALWVHRASPRSVVDVLLIVMALAWVWTCVQALPLSETVARGLGLPALASVARLDGLSWSGDVALSVSLDPGSTQLQILIGIGILSAFIAARLGGPAGLRPIAAAIVFSALLLGLEGVLHQLAGARAVFGSYTPRFVQPQLLTPLMNGNHLGGFALVGSLVSAGIAADTSTQYKRTWTVGAILCAIVVAVTLSRGAIGSLLFGFILLAAWLPGSRLFSRRRSMIPLLVLVAAALGTATFAGLEPILRRFETQGFDKLAVASRGFRLLEGSSWWLGIGRGAFSSTFVVEEGSLARFTHPENIFVQWTTEWGVPLALALFVALGLALWRRIRRTDDVLVASCCIAILALTLQNMVDFSLEMAGVVVVMAALLGALLPVSRPKNAKPHRRILRVTFVIFAAVVLILGPRVIQSDTQSIVDHLTRAMRADDESAFESTLRRGLALHPNEPTFALLAGTYAGFKGRPDAPRWLSVVMEEAPGWAAPHTVAARWLLANDKLDQSLVEIREAEMRHPGSARSNMCEALQRFPELKNVERASPTGDLRAPFLDRTVSCGGLTPELREEIDALILESEPAWPSAVLRQARRLATRDEPDQAKRMLRVALERDPDNASLWVAVIRANVSNGELAEAQAALHGARSRGLDNRSLTEAQARIEAALGQTDAMRASITRLRGQSRGEARLVAASFIVEGDLEASLGNVDEALTAYLAADRTDPKTPGLQLAAALALQSQRTTQARRLYHKLCLRRPGSTACDQESRLAPGRAAPRGRPPRP